MARPIRNPVPERPELERRFLARLAEAGGEMLRGALREAIHPQLRAPVMDEVAAALIRRRLVTTDRPMRIFHSIQGHSVQYQVLVYRLTERGQERTAPKKKTKAKEKAKAKPKVKARVKAKAKARRPAS